MFHVTKVTFWKRRGTNRVRAGANARARARPRDHTTLESTGTVSLLIADSRQLSSTVTRFSATTVPTAVPMILAILTSGDWHDWQWRAAAAAPHGARWRLAAAAISTPVQIFAITVKRVCTFPRNIYHWHAREIIKELRKDLIKFARNNFASLITSPLSDFDWMTHNQNRIANDSKSHLSLSDISRDSRESTGYLLAVTRATACRNVPQGIANRVGREDRPRSRARVRFWYVRSRSFD